MSDKTDQPQVNFNFDPIKVPVLYADTYLIGSNDNIVSFNFAQGIPGSNQQQVVSRVALTFAQAKEFVKNLNDHIERNEL
ncbi:MAG: DUF3467 domain-containing protein [Candidatus Saccharimonadales bacterium]